MKFTATLDTLTTVLTAVVLVIIPITWILAWYAMFPLFAIACMVFVTLVLGLFWALSPAYYYIDRHNLLAYGRMHFVFAWPPAEIKQARLVSKDEMGLAFRLMGSGGFLGYYGWFYSTRMGTMIWYATQRNNYVLLELTNGKKVVLTPDDPTGFVNELNAAKSA